MMTKRILITILVGLSACSSPDSNNAADVGTDVDDATIADTGEPDGAVDLDMGTTSEDAGTDANMGCSAAVPCPTPVDDSYTLSCVDSVCISTCEAGFQDDDGDGTCSAACTDEVCGVRGCDTVTGTAACVCPAGFFLDGADCKLDLILRDPELTDLAVWTVSGWTADFAGTDFNGNRGQLTVADQQVCGTNIASQELFVPAFEDVGPLKIQVDTEMNCADSRCWSGAVPVVTIAGVSSYPSHLSYAGGDESYEYCLPPAAYGAADTLLVRTQETDCDTVGGAVIAETNVARINIVPAGVGECENLNTIVNGDFEATQDGTGPGWKLEPDVRRETGPPATIVSVDGSNVARMEGTTCDLAKISTRFMANHAAGTALKFRYRTDPAVGMVVNFPRDATRSLGFLDLDRFVRFPEAPVWSTQSICLPASLRGADVALEFVPEGLTRGCGTPVLTEIDDVELVEDASCAATSLTNGDFESPQFGWAMMLNDASYIVPGQAIIGVAEFRTANNNTVVHLESRTRCAAPSLVIQEFMPPSVNAVSFDYQYRPYPEASPVGQVSLGQSKVQLTPSDTSLPGRVCIPPNSAGMVRHFVAQAGHAGGCAGESNMVPGYMQIDNVQFDNDPTCD